MGPDVQLSDDDMKRARTLAYVQLVYDDHIEPTFPTLEQAILDLGGPKELHNVLLKTYDIPDEDERGRNAWLASLREKMGEADRLLRGAYRFLREYRRDSQEALQMNICQFFGENPTVEQKLRIIRAASHL